MAYLAPTEMTVDEETGQVKMPFPVGGRGFMDACVQYAPLP